MLNTKALNTLITLILIAILLVIVYLVVKPVLISIFYGMLLAYILYPIQKRLVKKVKNPTLSAAIVSIVFVIVLIIAIVIVSVSLINQASNLFHTFQNMDLSDLVKKIIPNNPQLSNTITSYVNSYGSGFVNFLNDELAKFFSNIPNLILQLLIVAFVFFFTLRDGKKLLEHLKLLSPFKQEITDRIVKRFKEVTNSVLIGQIFVGLLQAAVCGIGYFIFRVPNITLLIYITLIVSLIPFTGHGLVWIPVDIYLFITGRTGAGIGFLIYGILVISVVENLARPIFVSKKANINTGLVTVGMLGGLLTFGLSGLLIGPLVLAYVLLFIDIYKKRMQDSEKEGNKV